MKDVLTATAEITLTAPEDLSARLYHHFQEHGVMTRAEGGWHAMFPIGTARAVANRDTLAFRVEAKDETSLAFLQWSVAEHVLAFAVGEKPEIAWKGGAAVGVAPPYFREMRVVEARQITPRMRRLTLTGRDLGRFAHGGLHMRLLLPPRPGVTPVWPMTGADGRQAWPEGDRPAARVYTIRRIDVAAGEIDVDFALHEGGEMPGATFARNARPGDVVGMTGPGGGEAKPADWILLAGDETALPAIARLLEDMPAGRRVVALIEIADDGERQQLRSRAELDIRWLPRDGRPAGTTTLLQDAVADLRFPDDGRSIFVWVGCEQAAFRAIRTHLRKERCLTREQHLAAAYWRLGSTGEAVSHD